MRKQETAYQTFQRAGLNSPSLHVRWFSHIAGYVGVFAAFGALCWCLSGPRVPFWTAIRMLFETYA